MLEYRSPVFQQNLITLLLFVASVTCCFAQERIALVIGNGSYRHVGPLDNPGNDAELMAEALETVGFQVTKVVDSDQLSMKRAISEFGRNLREAGTDATALFYYAGHAVQSYGNNYLLPIDSNIQHQADLDLYGVEADGILRQLFAARVQTSIVILDACRNNPFERRTGLSNEGLAEMDAPVGSFIAYATSPGKVATDGFGENSPYTSSLAKAILNTSQPIEQLFKSVRVDVLNQTSGQQTPWDSSSLTRDFYFREPPKNDARFDAESSFWSTISDTKQPEQLELFLKIYPDSTFRSQAEERLAALRKPEEPAAEPVPQPGGVGQALSFTTPIARGDPQIVGRSIQEVFTTASPLFPPIEGLPEELWKDQKCSNCHQWTKELLCDQGKFYLSSNATRSLEREHPLGGSFKMNLRDWAQGGCQ